MELKASSQKLGLTSSDFASDPEDKEISEGEDEDDDRNHKHRRKDAHSLSLEGDSFDQALTRPYRRRNKPFENGYSYREGDPQSGGTSKNYNLSSERDFLTRFEKRRINQASFSRAPSDLNHRIRGNLMSTGEGGPVRVRGREPFSWGLHDTRLGLVDIGPQMVQSGPIPSAIFAGRGLPNVSSAQNSPWNALGLVPGVPTGGLDAFHPLGLPGAMRPAISPPVNIAIPRQRCRDFEERGFCLRGDMCPMEHGLNRIVIEDVQSLSQFNLPVSLPGSQLPGTASGQGALPVIGTSSVSFSGTKGFHAKSGKPGVPEDGLGMNGRVGGSVAGGSDVYDPDQPLWTNDNAEPSAALLALNQSNAVETESFLDSSEHQNMESSEFNDEHPFRNGIVVGSQSSSVWGRIRNSANTAGPKEKNDFIALTSSYLEGGIRSEEALNPGLPDVPQGKWTSVDGNGQIVKESSLKTRNGSVRNVRKPSQKALRTLFVNGIPLKDNKREALLSHFKKFGEVIDIYIPVHSERAFVQFSRREEAEAALKAPDAVMGNRFIKLWWANRDNTPDDGISGSSSVPVTSHKMAPKPAPPHPFIPEKGKENPHPVGKDGIAHPSVPMPVYDHPKPMVNNGPKAPLQQKKLENLELLKEELRKKQEMLDRKRNEFRRQLDKLQKQAAISKDETVSDLATKRLKIETSSDHTKAETSKSSPRANIDPDHVQTSDVVMPHTSPANPAVSVQGPLRPSFRPLAPLGQPLAVNRFKLDNRPTTFRIVSPLPAGLANVSTLEEHFSAYGDLASVELEGSELKETNDASGPSNICARVSFATRHCAEKAFLHGKCWQGHDLKFVWFTSTSTGKDGPRNHSASFSMQLDASREAASAHSQTVADIGKGKSENLPKENDGESTEQDKNSKSTSTSSSCEEQLS